MVNLCSGRAYLVSVPAPGNRQAGSNTQPQFSNTPAQPPAVIQPFYLRAWEIMRTIWPSLWLAAKLLFFYTFLSSGSSIYKQILLGVVAALIFAFQHGVIDIQIEVVRNQPGEPQNPQAPPPRPNVEPDQVPATPSEASPNVTPPAVQQQPLHPALEALRSFFVSLFPTREHVENPRPQWG